MASDSENNLRLEIGHVLFIDLVGYSKLLIEEQKERLHDLTEIVLATAQVRESTDEQLVRLPTGDGMALVFLKSSEEPARCAVEIAEALKKHPEIPVRMGIHSGPVSEVTDVSGRPNSSNLILQKAEIDFATGNLPSAGELLQPLPLDGQDASVLLGRVNYWIFSRQDDEAIAVLRGLLAEPEKLPEGLAPTYRAWLGIVEGLTGYAEPARADLAQARDQLAAIHAQGDKAPRLLRILILSSGILHDKAAVDRFAGGAEQEIQHDAMDGPGIEEAVAMARAHLGETDAAIASVQHLLQTFGEASLTPAYLRLDPLWDPLRSDPRFEKLSQP